MNLRENIREKSDDSSEEEMDRSNDEGKPNRKLLKRLSSHRPYEIQTLIN